MNSDRISVYQVVISALLAAVSVRVAARNAPTRSTPLQMNHWAVQVEGGAEAAEVLAAKYGFINNGQIGNLKDVFELVLPENEYTRAGRSITAPYQQVTNTLNRDLSVIFAEQQVVRKMEKKGYKEPTDPDWSKQWYLLNSDTGVLQTNSDSTRDLNVEPAWIQGVTGCNVVVGVVDDGVDFTHPDLSSNYVEELDYDAITGKDSAIPLSINGTKDNHGTACAGIIGMEKSNNVCGVGVAYESQLIGIRLVAFEGQTDIAEARGLAHKNNIIDVYSNSWGPNDSGYIVQGPGRLATMVFETSSQMGRDGKGSIYVWAAGNGGNSDSCAADGYVQSIYTIAIGSLSSGGSPAYYDEKCSAKLASTFVNNIYHLNLNVATTDVDGNCVEAFDGTSAATPVASGSIALALEVNPDLTWRDVQYLIVYTSNPDIVTVDDLTTNGAGLKFSHSSGFGAIDAEAMVTRARHWTNVPLQMKATISTDSTPVQPMSNSVISVSYSGEVGYLEHVVVQISLSFEGVNVVDYVYNDVYDNLYHNFSDYDQIMPNRGDIQVELTSPQGTKSILLPQRSKDIWPGNYYKWPFMSVHFWGEDPSGDWMLNIINSGSSGVVDVCDVEFTFYGTTTIPEVIARIPSQCHSSCARRCAKPEAMYCDSCKQLRDATTLQCVDQCGEGQVTRSGYCYNTTEPEPKCEKKSLIEIATTPMPTVLPTNTTTESAASPLTEVSPLVILSILLFILSY